MAQTPTSGNHSAQAYNPWNRYKSPATTTWGSTANTCTITDDKISKNSAVLVWVTGTTPQAGFWSVSVSTAGSLVITSSSAEASTLPISYIIL